MQSDLIKKKSLRHVVMTISYLCSGIATVGLVLFFLTNQEHLRSTSGYSASSDLFGGIYMIFTLVTLAVGVIAGVSLRGKIDSRILWLPVLLAIFLLSMSLFMPIVK